MPFRAPALQSLSIALLLALFLSFPAEPKPLESVPDLERAMYISLDAYPCVRLLNLSGEIGCSNPARDKVVAPIVPLRTVRDHPKPSAVLVPAAQMQTFLLNISQDPVLSRNVAGVLVEPPLPGEPPRPSSPARKFPLAEFAPYSAPGYEWNPAGSAIMWDSFDFPVFLLQANATAAVREMAELNLRGTGGRFENVAEFDAVMQTTQRGTRDSDSCLKARTCLPLGGYSVWSSLPPINPSDGARPRKPLVLAVATMDAASFFRDRSVGADSPLSGLICLLAAADALSRLDGLDDLAKRVVFLVLTGESWGYIGSRRFLAELDSRTAAVDGLDAGLIDMVLEIGAVGRSVRGGDASATFFAHFETGVPAVENVVHALENASDSLLGVKTRRASSSNPGVPPSSLMALLRNRSSIAGVVLEEFDKAFVNEFYHSHLDDIGNVNSSSILAAASLVARTLYILALGDDHPPSTSQLDALKVTASLVEELMGCLLSCEPGFSCGLVRSFISASSVCPNHYVGVFLDSPSDTQFPQYVDDTSRFVWNFLADRTSVHADNASSCTGKCSDAGQVCVGATSGKKGRCLFSSTRYVPAYSTRLKFTDGLWHVLPANSSDPLGMVDPVWTESYWNVISLRAYMVQSSAYDLFALLGGVIVTIMAYAAVIISQAYLMKVVKHD